MFQTIFSQTQNSVDEYSTENYYIHIENYYETISLKQMMLQGVQPARDVRKRAICICQAMTYMNEDMHCFYGAMTPLNLRFRQDGIPVLFDVGCATDINAAKVWAFDLE